MRLSKEYWQEQIRKAGLGNDDIAMIQLIIIWLLNIAILCLAALR